MNAKEANNELEKMRGVPLSVSDTYKLSDLMCFIGRYHTLAAIMLDILKKMKIDKYYEPVANILFDIGRVDIIEMYPALKKYLTSDRLKILKTILGEENINFRKVLIIDNYNSFSHEMVRVLAEKYAIWRLPMDSRYLDKYDNVLKRAAQWADVIWIDGVAENIIIFSGGAGDLQKTVIVRILGGSSNLFVMRNFEKRRLLIDTADWVVFASDLWKTRFKATYPHIFNPLADRMSVVYPYIKNFRPEIANIGEISTDKVLIVVHDETAAPIAVQIAFKLAGKKSVSMLVRAENPLLEYYTTKLCRRFLKSDVRILGKITENELKDFEWIIFTGVVVFYTNEPLELISRGCRVLVYASPHAISVIPESLLFRSVSEVLQRIESGNYHFASDDFKHLQIDSVAEQIESAIESAVKAGKRSNSKLRSS